MKLAVIATGGKQYVVIPGQKLKIEKLTAAEGEIVKLPALLLADGDAVTIGKPTVSATIPATVLVTEKGDKVSVIKFKSKVRYRRVKGHRQIQTQIQIGQF
jgi:large subunit ribosomal protein L21